MQCPKCGSTAWTKVKEQSTQTYSNCSNCHYSPALEKTEPVDAKTWVEGIAKERAEAEEALRIADLALAEKNTTLTLGKFNKAKRLLALAEKKMVVAEALSTIVGETESGQITLLIPELGLYQFEYGTFDLFGAISSVTP